MPINKRKNDRRHLIDFLDVFEANDDILFGNLIDVTLQGIKISTQKPVDVGSFVTLKLKIPDYYNSKKKIVFGLVCLWTKKNIDSYFSGLKFKNISDEDLNLIKSLFL